MGLRSGRRVPSHPGPRRRCSRRVRSPERPPDASRGHHRNDKTPERASSFGALPRCGTPQGPIGARVLQGRSYCLGIRGERPRAGNKDARGPRGQEVGAGGAEGELGPLAPAPQRHLLSPGTAQRRAGEYAAHSLPPRPLPTRHHQPLGAPPFSGSHPPCLPYTAQRVPPGQLPLASSPLPFTPVSLPWAASSLLPTLWLLWRTGGPGA